MILRQPFTHVSKKYVNPEVGINRYEADDSTQPVWAFVDPQWLENRYIVSVCHVTGDTQLSVSEHSNSRMFGLSKPRRWVFTVVMTLVVKYVKGSRNDVSAVAAIRV